MDDRRTRLERARLYLVCDATAGELVPRALRGGVDIVQLRAKQRADDEIVAAGRRYARHCAAHDALLIVNARPDLVEEIGADGVHVGQDDLAVDEAREMVGIDRLIGLSTHTPAQIDELGAAGVISGGMLPKLAGAVDAVQNGVRAVHIIDGRVAHSMLLDVLTEQAFGTMVRS